MWKHRGVRKRFTPFLVTVGILCASGVSRAEDLSRQVFVVPNFHPASCGWLTHFSRERNYCANSYLDHLDRVADDPEVKGHPPHG